MSSPPTNEEAEDIARIGFQITCFFVSFTALFFYEYIITLSSEIELVWRRRATGATVLFALNRYVTALYLILWMVQNWPCGSVYLDITLFIYSLKSVMYAVLAVFSALRVYAIRDRSVTFGLAVLALGLVPFATNLYNYSQLREVYTKDSCDLLSTVPQSEQNRFVIATRVSLLLMTLLVMVATLLTTLGLPGSRAEATMLRVPLMTMVLRDGSIYFATLSVMNILEIALTLSGIFPYTADYVEVLTSMLLSRFFLNLRHVHMTVNSRHTRSETEQQTGTWTGVGAGSSHNTEIRFALASHIIGNMGAPLRVGFTDSDVSYLEEEASEHDNETPVRQGRWERARKERESPVSPRYVDSPFRVDISPQPEEFDLPVRRLRSRVNAEGD